MKESGEGVRGNRCGGLFAGSCGARQKVPHSAGGDLFMEPGSKGRDRDREEVRTVRDEVRLTSYSHGGG
jgi:hypothetical protein